MDVPDCTRVAYSWSVLYAQEKREEYHRAQREEEDREIERKKQAAREQVRCTCCIQVHHFILYIHGQCKLYGCAGTSPVSTTFSVKLM